jgi:hypothetical protein
VFLFRLLLQRCFSPGVLQKGAKAHVCKKYQIADKTVNSIWERGRGQCEFTQDVYTRYARFGSSHQYSASPAAFGAAQLKACIDSSI